MNELGFNEDDFNEAVEDDLDDPDEEILDDPNDEEDEDYQDPNDPNVNKTETNNTTDDENKKLRSPVKKPRAPKTCEKCHKTYNTQTQFRIHQRVITKLGFFIICTEEVKLKSAIKPTIPKLNSGFIRETLGDVRVTLTPNV